ncbi:MAG TPA: hypothetical protein VFV66_21175 [Nonomuraea sp.]|nr:hypothetical protein [Nonomuraea sp.]
MVSVLGRHTVGLGRAVRGLLSVAGRGRLWLTVVGALAGRRAVRREL